MFIGCKVFITTCLKKSIVSETIFFFFAIVDPGLVSEQLNIELNVMLKMSKNHQILDFSNFQLGVETQVVRMCRSLPTEQKYIYWLQSASNSLF